MFTVLFAIACTLPALAVAGAGAGQSRRSPARADHRRPHPGVRARLQQIASRRHSQRSPGPGLLGTGASSAAATTRCRRHDQMSPRRASRPPSTNRPSDHRVIGAGQPCPAPARSSPAGWASPTPGICAISARVMAGSSSRCSSSVDTMPGLTGCSKWMPAARRCTQRAIARLPRCTSSSSRLFDAGFVAGQARSDDRIVHRGGHADDAMNRGARSARDQ